MILAQNLIIIFTLIFLLPHLISEAANSNCSKSFECANLGTLEFPLSNQTGCGLFTVQNCDTQNPTIQFGADGYTYNLLANKSANKLLVSDPYLQNHLNTRFCLGIKNLTLPPSSSPSATLTVLPNITLFACINSSSNSEPILHRFENYKYVNCSPWDVYYKNPATSVSATDMPSDCSLVQVPINSTRNPESALPDLMSYEFIIEWNVTEECYRCHHGGGQCITNAMNQFQCDIVKGEKNSHLVVVIASMVGGGVLLIVGFSVYCAIIWRRKKRIKAGHALSKDTSFDRLSKSGDIEGDRSYFGIPIFSYTELVEATNKFDPSKEIGDGGYGTVYYGKLQDGREVAIKRLYEHNHRRVDQFMNEIKILTCLRHKNLVSLYGCTSRRSQELLLVYEYISNGTVAEHLHGEQAQEAPLSWPIRMSVAIETASALAYLHKSDIVHRDVKTCNILLDANFCVKVADFGISRLFPTDATHISTAPQGTPGYVDPEYYKCYQLTDKSDVYSFGVVLAELISSMPAVDLTRHRDEINLANLAVNRIQRCAFDELIDSSLGYNRDDEVTRMATSVAELAFRCLQMDKDMRPSMNEVVGFLRDIQGGEDCKYEKAKGRNSNYRKIPSSPEMDGVVMLKKKNDLLMSSPNAVIDSWASNSSTNKSSIG